MNCLKGLPTNSLIWGEAIRWVAFIPPSTEQPDAEGWFRSSVNWEEIESDGRPLNILLNQTKSNGEKQFRAGVARIPRDSIDRIIVQHQIEHEFRYEHEPIEGNDFHGNIKFHQTLNRRKADRAQICTALARAVVKRIPQNGE